MLNRLIREKVTTYSELFPAVLIIGPRQCGKTTLVKETIEGQYFDLEKLSDYAYFDNDLELAFKSIQGPIIIDEAHLMPKLFSFLRSHIDEKRKKNGQIYLLGSVNPLLIKEISESLAGRIGIIDMTPLLLQEIESKSKPDTHWFRGGFPDAFLAETDSHWSIWQENYIRTFVERDVGRHNLDLSSAQSHQFLRMVAQYHGNILNASELGKAMGVSYHTINRYLDILEACFIIRRLTPYYHNTLKRLVKSPKIYIRDSGLLHALHNIQNEQDSFYSPKRGNSFEGYAIEQIIASSIIKNKKSEFFYYRTHAGLEVDLIEQRGINNHIGYEIKTASHASKKEGRGISQLIKDGIVQKGYIICMTERPYPINDKITVTNLSTLLTPNSQ